MSSINQFKLSNVMKLSWLKNNSDAGGAMQMVINSCPSEHVVIHSQTKKNGRMWCDVSETELLNVIKKNNGIYEVLSKYPQKVHFDIDRNHDDLPSEENQAEFYNKITSNIDILFPNGGVAISGSITDKKTSYHMTLNNYVLNDKADKEKLKVIVKYLHLNCDEAFDTKIYTSNRNWKCVNQSKDDGRIQTIIFNQDVRKHLIGSFIDTESVLPFPTFKDIDTTSTITNIIKLKEVKQFISSEKVNSKLDIGTLTKMNLTLPTGFDVDICSNLELLNLLPLDATFGHDYTYRACLFSYFNNISFDEFFNWYQQKNSTQEKKNKWLLHYNSMINKTAYTKESLMKVLKFYYKELNVSVKMANFSKLFEISTEPSETIEYLDQSIFRDNTKYTIITHGMSSGKTAQTI